MLLDEMGKDVTITSLISEAVKSFLSYSEEPRQFVQLLQLFCPFLLIRKIHVCAEIQNLSSLPSPSPLPTPSSSITEVVTVVTLRRVSL